MVGRVQGARGKRSGGGFGDLLVWGGGRGALRSVSFRDWDGGMVVVVGNGFLAYCEASVVGVGSCADGVVGGDVEALEGRVVQEAEGCA